MSFAIIQTGGKQYKVKASEILKIEQLENLKPESKIEFNEILAYGDDKTIEIGSPLIKGAKVEAELLKNGKKEGLEESFWENGWVRATRKYKDGKLIESINNRLIPKRLKDGKLIE